MKYVVFSLLFASFLSPFSILNAQIGVSPNDEVVLEINPSNPGPNQSVNAVVKSYLFDINASRITWYLNGVNKKSGRGETSFSFTAGGNTQTTTLSVTVISPQGQTTTKSISFKPSDIDLIWEADGYAPPFYKGKTSFTHQNRIKFIATPHLTNSSGAEISPANLIYKWSRNGAVVESASGYGKNTFTLLSPLISRQIDIDLEVTPVTGNAFAKTSISAKPTEPFVLMYKKDPLYGIEFGKALTGTVDLGSLREIAVFGAPYFYDDSSLEYKWSINGAKIQDSNTTEVFRRVEGTSGTSKISLSIQNSEKLLQFAQTSFNLNFKDENSISSEI